VVVKGWKAEVGLRTGQQAFCHPCAEGGISYKKSLVIRSISYRAGLHALPQAFRSRFVDAHPVLIVKGSNERIRRRLPRIRPCKESGHGRDRNVVERTLISFGLIATSILRRTDGISGYGIRHAPARSRRGRDGSTMLLGGLWGKPRSRIVRILG